MFLGSKILPGRMITVDRKQTVGQGGLPCDRGDCVVTVSFSVGPHIDAQI